MTARNTKIDHTAVRDIFTLTAVRGRMASWFLVCDCRCGDAVDEGCDPRDELAELDALVERLRLKRYDLKRKINRHHSPIIRHLPPDVTSTIFEFCLPDFTGHELFLYSKDDFFFPLSLGTICSYWRDIAWSTPSLWSSLVVRVAGQRDSRISHYDNSQSHYFWLNPTITNINPNPITTLLVVTRSACSLRSFTMILYSPHFEAFMSLLQSMPSLNSLSITLGNTALEDYYPRNILQLVAKILSSQSTSLQQGFLPNLRILEYTGKLYLPSKNYDALYFLPPVDNAVHGPLYLLKLKLYPVTRIPKVMISYLSSLVERGITVEVSSNWEDILQPSIDYYRCRKDSVPRLDW